MVRSDDGGGPRRLDRARDVAADHLAALDHHRSLGVQSLDMAAGDADVDRVDLRPRFHLGLVHGPSDRLDGALDVDHHALSESPRKARPDPDDMGLTVLAGFRHDRPRLGGAYVQTHDDLVFPRHAPPHLPSRTMTLSRNRRSTSTFLRAGAARSRSPQRSRTRSDTCRYRSTLSPNCPSPNRRRNPASYATKSPGVPRSTTTGGRPTACPSRPASAIPVCRRSAVQGSRKTAST